MPKPSTISPELAKKVTPAKVEKARKTLEDQAPRKRSAAWKGLEYAIAEALVKAGFKKAKRFMKLDQMSAASHSEELCDINLPECPHIKIDGKYSAQRDGKGWDKVEALFLKCETKYALEARDRFIMVTQKSGSRNKIAHLRLEFFAELLAQAYLGGKSSDVWTCPRCRQETLTTSSAGMGQELTSCSTCSLEFLTPKGTRPV